MAPETDALTFSEIAGHEGVTPQTEDFSDADAENVPSALHAATNAIDEEEEVTTASRILFITPTLKGVLDDFSLTNPARSNRVSERLSRFDAYSVTKPSHESTSSPASQDKPFPQEKRPSRRR